MRNMENLGNPLSHSESAGSEPSEEIIDNGLGILIHHKTLYHGSATAGIESLQQAEEYTMGHGVYLTSEADKAGGYGKVRARNQAQPFVYMTEISNLKLVDLRQANNVEQVARGILPRLRAKLEEYQDKGDVPWYYSHAVQRAIEMIEEGNFGKGRVEAVAQYPIVAEVFEEYVRSLGYDGVIGVEGGEGGEDMAIGDHDTYVIFNPEQVKVIAQRKAE